MAIKVVGVIGSGQMGSGIVQVAAMNGFDVIVHDASAEALLKSRQRIEQNLQKYLEKSSITDQELKQTKSRIRASQHLEDMAQADIVIEAVNENPKMKFELFKTLDSLCRDDVVLASNTSSISITAIGSHTRRPDKIIGMHFMNPVPIMKLVEVIRGLKTSDEAFQKVKVLAEKLGKTPIVSKDYPGFVVNRILMPMINEACYAHYEGLASVEDIDSAMKLGTNQPMGPLALADFIGLDTCLAILNVLYEGLGDPKYRPCPLLKQYVSAGLFGKKTNEGFYKYDKK